MTSTLIWRSLVILHCVFLSLTSASGELQSLLDRKCLEKGTAATVFTSGVDKNQPGFRWKWESNLTPLIIFSVSGNSLEDNSKLRPFHPVISANKVPLFKISYQNGNAIFLKNIHIMTDSENRSMAIRATGNSVAKERNYCKVSGSDLSWCNVIKMIGINQIRHQRATPKTNHQLLNSIKLSVAANAFPPYSFKMPNKGGYDGIHYRLLESSAKKFNFTFTISTPEWKSTGIQLSNGTWTGMMGDLLYRGFDIALVLTPTENRYSFVDFSCPVGVAHLVFFSANAEIDINKLALLSPYAMSVWLAMLLSFMTMVFAIHKVARVTGVDRMSLTESYFLIVSMSLEHSTRSPNKSLRILTTIWMIYILTIATGYKCNLVSYLSTPAELEDKPRTFQQLNDAKDYNVYFDLAGISGYEYFNKSQERIIQSLKKRTIPTSDSSVCILNAFSNSKSVCIGWDIALPLVIAKNLSSLHGKRRNFMYKSQHPVYFTYGSLAFPKNSKFTKFFDFVGMSFFETGMILKWHDLIIQYFEKIGRDWALSDSSRPDVIKKISLIPSESERKSLQLKHFQILFYISALGMLLSSITFLYEIVRFHAAQRN
jgi:hypothetical protein